MIAAPIGTTPEEWAVWDGLPAVVRQVLIEADNPFQPLSIRDQLLNARAMGFSDAEYAARLAGVVGTPVRLRPRFVVNPAPRPRRPAAPAYDIQGGVGDVAQTVFVRPIMYGHALQAAAARPKREHRTSIIGRMGFGGRG